MEAASLVAEDNPEAVASLVEVPSLVEDTKKECIIPCS